MLKFCEMYALGVDIGGTNCVFGLVAKNGDILVEKNVKTASLGGPQELVNHIFEDSVVSANLELLVGIGVGAPNGNPHTGNIEFAPNLPWKGIIPLKTMFEAKFQKPAYLTNDANAAAIGEHLFGNAKDLQNFVTITLGTGLGSGIISNGEILEGEHGSAGEYGHIRMFPNGRLCGCGRFGCLETYASATGVRRTFETMESENRLNSSLNIYDKPSASDIFDEAKKGDSFALEIVDYTAQILGSALADFTAFSDPKAFVLFGGVAQAGSFFSERVKIEMEKNQLNIYKDKVEIRISGLLELNAAILGTAAHVFAKYSKK